MSSVAAATSGSAGSRIEIDELTLRRAQRGDEAAWRALVARHQHAVHGLIWRLLAGRARHRTEDLAQETFVRVIRALPRFDPQGPATLATWILTIATRLTLNELRRPDMGALADEPAAAEDAHAPVERRRLAASIGAAMAALPPYQRAAIVLRELHGLDYSEIASVLDIDVGTVKSRLSRARAALREALAEDKP